LLVDTDMAGTLPMLYKALKAADIRVNEIDYVLATHYHPDHMGLISALMEQGVKLLLMDVQRDFVHYSDGIFARDRRLGYTPIDERRAVVVSCEESRSFLRRLGIDGEICRTPSHSEDSVSLFLDNGNCFVGDLDPIGYLPGYADNVQLEADWELVIAREPKVVYYAHTPAERF